MAFALLEKVTSALAASRELDAEICAHFRLYDREPSRVPPFWLNWKGEIKAIGDRVVLMESNGKEGPWTKAEAVTSDIDAALYLVNIAYPDTLWAIAKIRPGREEFKGLICPSTFPKYVEAEGATPSLALLAAMFTAMQKENRLG